MSRALFAGWMPDADGRERLAKLVSALEAARPAGTPPLKPRRPGQWHATLCFIAHAPPDYVVATARHALASVASAIPTHDIAIGRLAYWVGPGVIVALPRQSDALQALCDECSRSLRRAGIVPDHDTSQPHVTLARPGRHLPPQAWLGDVDCAGPALRVDRFQLLFNPGGRYEVLGDWPLQGAAWPSPSQHSAPS